MKGNKKRAKNVKVYKGGGKNTNRTHLHAGNNYYNEWARKHKIPAQLPGYPQGKHIPKNQDCMCGGCNSREVIET